MKPVLLSPVPKAKHGGELVLIPPLALSKLHTSVKERGAPGVIAGVVTAGGGGWGVKRQRKRKEEGGPIPRGLRCGESCEKKIRRVCEETGN